MKLIRSALFLLVCSVYLMPPTASQAADANCTKEIQETARHTRDYMHVYLNEMKNMVDNPWARNSASVCSSALARAEQYLKRQVATNSLCTQGSTYVDNQTRQLFKTANSTCRSEFTDVLSKMSLEEQQTVSSRIARAEAALRREPVPSGAH